MAFNFNRRKLKLKHSTAPRPQLTLLLDERQDRLDSGLIRTIIGCVEVGKGRTTDDIADAVKVALGDIIKESGKKLHFAELDQPEKTAVTQALSKLEFTAKVWVFYDSLKNPSEAKTSSLRYAIGALKKKHSKREVTFLVEHASEYAKVVKEQFMTSNPYLSLLPDLTCYIMGLKLDTASILGRIEDEESRAKRREESKQMIFQMHEHIRLQVFHTDSSNRELTRSNRL